MVGAQLCIDWEQAPQALCLGQEDIHIWSIGIHDFLPELPDFYRLLSPDERERHQKICGQANKNRFVIVRGILRKILGRYLHRPPEEIRLCYGECGKPALGEKMGMQNISFNLSHSYDRVLYIFCCKGSIGIDIEKIRPDYDFEGVRKIFFTPDENKRIDRQPCDQKPEAFFGLWTCKEACLKALGKGLACPPGKIDASAVYDHGHAVLQTDGSFIYKVQLLHPFPNYLAAFAYCHEERELRYFKISSQLKG